MNQDTDQDLSKTKPPERIERQGKGLVKIHNPFSGGEKPEPPQIVVTHRRPQPKPPYFRIPADAQVKLTEAQAAAEKARQEIEQIEDHYRDRERDLDELKRNIRTQTKGLEVFRRGLARIEPSKLAKEWEDSYWAHVHDPFDQHTTNQWLLIASLKANSVELRKMLTRKLEEAEGSIAAMEAQAAALEKELGAEAASIE
jgi:predicted  nucleic acid-binding Zn-ribbon protein